MPQLYESDLHDVINIDMWRTSLTDHTHFHSGLYMHVESMPGLLAIAKDMMRSPPVEEGNAAFVTDRSTNRVWFERVAEVLKLELKGSR
jgi:hypothetical protein